MTDIKCPMCGAEMKHVAINYLGYSDNGHHYECPECDYSEYIKPRHLSPGFDVNGHINTRGEDAGAYKAPGDKPITHFYGGTITDVSYEGNDTVVRVRLDKADKSIDKAHVLIIYTEVN